jgi:hypothetical protein
MVLNPSRKMAMSSMNKTYLLPEEIALLEKAATLRRLGFTAEETSAIIEKCQGALQWQFRTAKQYAVEAST